MKTVSIQRIRLEGGSNNGIFTANSFNISYHRKDGKLVANQNPRFYELKAKGGVVILRRKKEVDVINRFKAMSFTERVKNAYNKLQKTKGEEA